MRLALSLALAVVLAAAASPALAQLIQPNLRFSTQDTLLRAQQDQAERQAVIQQNELSRLDSQLRTQRNMSALQSQTITPLLPAPPASGAIPQIDTNGLVSIPDSALAASNARVRAAAGDER